MTQVAPTIWAVQVNLTGFGTADTEMFTVDYSGAVFVTDAPCTAGQLRNGCPIRDDTVINFLFTVPPGTTQTADFELEPIGNTRPTDDLSDNFLRVVLPQ